jgi:DNA polymerase III gamma/tau subunit
VLATTDPQKVSDTIRSRTQHLRFHLLPMDELEQHVRWVSEDAGLNVSEAAIQAALEQGAGSARDTLSALELIASTGGDSLDVVDFGEFVESLIDLDPGRALTAVAFAMNQGRDPRTLTEDIVRHLRDCFLSLMAPELVALPDTKAKEVAEQAVRLGAGKVVRSMERLGQILVDMRHAPDARLLLEVALVQLTHEASANDMGTVIDEPAARLFESRVNEAVAQGARLLVGNQRRGALYAPTVLDRVDPTMTVAREETFGPVSPIIRFKDINDAIRISNGTAYGLSSSVCTNRLDYITRFVRELNVGTVNVREVPGYRLELTPFGGIKDSGLGYK